jgi:hypothetical protein
VKTIFLLLFFVTASHSAFAQDSTRAKRFEYVAGASLAFSLLDYVGFNIAIRQLHNSEPVYHAFQSAVQAGITYFLYQTCGIKSAISFNLIWWTWTDDIGYYGWGYLLNPTNSDHWENRSHNGLMSEGITWASWTPIGLLRPAHDKISREALVAQSIIGVSVAIPLLW